MRPRPFIQHVVLIRKSRVVKQPVSRNTVQYKHYSSSYPPLLCLPFTCSGPCEPALFSSLLSEQSWQCCKVFCVQTKMRSCRFHNLKTAICQRYSAVFIFKRSLKLCCIVGSKEVFDAVWEGSALATWLDVCMVAQSRTKVALTVHPPFCSNIQTCSGRHGGCCSQGVGARIRADTR